MIIQGNLKNIKRVMNKVDSNAALKAGVEKLVEYSETRITLQARREVYSYTPRTDTYRRTGRLLGGATGTPGAPYVKKNSDFNFNIAADPTRKGADYNYAPAVNYGFGWMKHVGPRPFWSKAMEEITTTGLNIAIQKVKDNINKK